MNTADVTTSRHHPSWREIRDSFLADPDVQQAYLELEPRFAVVRQLIALREEGGVPPSGVNPWAQHRRSRC